VNDNTITTLVTYIHQNTNTTHSIFTYGTSVYIRVQKHSNGEIYYSIESRFKTFKEAQAFRKGYIAAHTLFQFNNIDIVGSCVKTVSLDGYTVQEFKFK